jgi:dolichyl-phosphate-mannose-protein mannosyltransferase
MREMRMGPWNHRQVHRAALPSRIVVPALVLLIAAGLRLWGLGTPGQPYGDESYYIFDAAAYLGGGIVDPIGDHPPTVRIADEGSWVHPPLGKWIIALLGVGPIGQRPIGWRFPSAVYGIVGVALLYLLALRLWKSVWWAGLASLLLALDGLHIVQSRIAMLDIFLTTFVTAAVLFLVLDRERMESPRTTRRWRRTERLFGSPFRLWAGVFLGCAVATKWSGAFALPFGAGLCAVWTFTAGRRRDRSTLATISTLVASFVLVPLGVYLLSYGAFFYQHGFAVQDFLTLQTAMLRYQEAHLVVQPENSMPWTWPLLLHPVRYFGLMRDGTSSVIVALGNPLLWWGFLVLLPVALVQIVRRPSWQDAVVFGGYAAMFLPWFAVGRTQFIWYMLPAVPFMCLGVVATLRRLPPSARKPLAITICIGALFASVIFLPIWTGWRIPDSWIRALAWLPDWPR